MVRGVVIAEAGRLGTPRAVRDRRRDRRPAGPPRRRPGRAGDAARSSSCAGTIAAPYGQTELRLVAGGLVDHRQRTPARAHRARGGARWRGDRGPPRDGHAGRSRRARAKATSGDIAFTHRGHGRRRRCGSWRMRRPGSIASVLRKGATATLTGIVGQRASRKGALDGYRLWVRDRADVLRRPRPHHASPGASGSPRASASASPRASAVRGRGPAPVDRLARQREGKRVTVEGILTVDRHAPRCLAAGGPSSRTRHGAIELYLARADASMPAGVRVRATGMVGRAWGAPRLRVDAVRVLGPREPAVHDLRVAPGAATEWRLVRVRGTLADVHRSATAGPPSSSPMGSGSRSSACPAAGSRPRRSTEGRTATVTGHRQAALPDGDGPAVRGRAALGRDLALGVRPRRVHRTRGAAGGRPPARPRRERLAAARRSGAPAPPAHPRRPGADVALRDLAARSGEPVRVGGLVTAVEPDAIRLDDGTATARVVLEGPAAELAALLQPGDALNATGNTGDPRRDVLVVSDPAGVVLLGDLGDDAGDSPGGRSARHGRRRGSRRSTPPSIGVGLRDARRRPQPGPPGRGAGRARPRGHRRGGPRRPSSDDRCAGGPETRIQARLDAIVAATAGSGRHPPGRLTGGSTAPGRAARADRRPPVRGPPTPVPVARRTLGPCVREPA